MDHRIEPEAIPEVDTITAVSTPTGEGGIGLVRLSGPAAVPIACRLFRHANGQPLTNPVAAHLYYGHLVDPESGAVVDEVLLSVMRAPRSYTREDVVEINGHGGQASLRAILALTCAAGARLALPGEFTQRAFLNGRIDLTQAEAVLDTIRARSTAALRAAQQVLGGALAGRVRALRARLVTLLAALEVAIDYADEGLAELTPAEIAVELSGAQADVQALIASHARGKLLREGAATAIIGRPNTGKSSLLNTLLGEARAIVTDVPGTTRDTIEEQFELAGVPLRLLDTAGIHRTDDVVERLGVARSRASLAAADLVLLVLERSTPLQPEDRELLAALRERPAIVVLNKADLPAAFTLAEVREYLDAPLIACSALTGDGVPALQDAMRALLLGDAVVSEAPQLANLRQLQAAERAADALRDAECTLRQGGSEELLAVDLLAAAAALGEITGEDVREEVIHELFARFCVGK